MSITLKESGQYGLVVHHQEEIVGTLTRQNRIPKWVYRDVKDAKDLSLISSVDKPDENMHLYFAMIEETYRRNGYFSEAMKKFEERCIDKDFKSITLLAKIGKVQMYKKLGYKSVGFLESIGSFLMEKKLAA